MKTKKSFFSNNLLLLTFFLTTSIFSYAQQVINTTIQHDGRTRRYRLYIPQSYDASKPSPLILNYHGFTNNIDVQYNQSAFQQLAEDNQFIFATPQGLGFLAGWAINNSFGGNQDDVGFTNAMIDQIESQYNINPKRIYATGFSNGGFFSYRLACELSNRIAAVASVAGSMTRVWIDNNQCQPQHPTAVLQITGSNDNVISINGNGSNEPIRDVMEYWSAFNNGDSSPDVIDLGSGSTRSIWDNGNNGVTAEFIRVQGRGHSWNGGNVNTSQEIWNFFSRFDIDGAISSTPPPPPGGCATTITSFPYAESFEGNIGDWRQDNSDDLNWIVNSNSTPSSGTGPSAANDGNSYIYMEVSGNGDGYPNKRAILNSPCIDLSSLATPTLSFNYHMLGNAVGSLSVEARTNNTGSWTSIFNISGSQGSNWNQANVSLASYAAEASVQLRINAVSGTSWQGDIAIDNLSINSGTGTPPDSDCDALNFNNFTVNGFSNQDNDGDFSVSADGSSLILTNNTWKYINFDYVVTPNTVIEFEFSSTSEGEIHSIGFEDNNTLTSSRYFKVFGTQNYGVTNFDDYSGSGTKTYAIPIGDSYTGSMDRLVFINDNDAGSGNNSTFSNIRIYEGSCGSSNIIASRSAKRIDVIGNEDENETTISMQPNPTVDLFSITVNSKSNEKTTASIFNLLGQKKYETSLNSGTNNFSATNLSLSSGIYIIQIHSNGNKAIIKKLVIKQ